MGRSLYTKLVLIIMALIVAFMAVAGAFLLHGVRNFYLEQFYEEMQSVFPPRSWRRTCAAQRIPTARRLPWRIF